MSAILTFFLAKSDLYLGDTLIEKGLFFTLEGAKFTSIAEAQRLLNNTTPYDPDNLPDLTEYPAKTTWKKFTELHTKWENTTRVMLSDNILLLKWENTETYKLVYYYEADIQVFDVKNFIPEFSEWKRMMITRHKVRVMPNSPPLSVVEAYIAKILYDAPVVLTQEHLYLLDRLS